MQQSQCSANTVVFVTNEWGIYLLGLIECCNVVRHFARETKNILSFKQFEMKDTNWVKFC